MSGHQTSLCCSQLVSWEFHTRLVSSWCRYRVFIKFPFGFMCVLNFIVSFVTSGVGAYYDLDYDYCKREHFGNYWFRLYTSVAFYAIPCLITTFFLSDTTYVLHHRLMSVIRLKRYMQLKIDKGLSHLHLLCYALFVVAWIPYLVLVHKYPDAVDATYYALIWVGLVRSTVTSFLYSTLNANIREAFKSLFIYCCCKTPIPQPSNGRLVNGFYRDANGVREEPAVQYVM